MPENQKAREVLLEKILKDRNLRTKIVQESFEWFFTIYFHHYMKYETAPFHEEMFHIAEDDSIKLVVIAAFRGSAKSTIITTAYVLWAILGKQQKKYIPILSGTEQKARQHLMNIKRELEENELLRKDLGPFQEERNQWGAQSLFIPRFKAQIRIGSIEQNIRGTRQSEFRPDLIILDDAEDTNSVKSQEGRDKTFDWFTGEIIPSGDKNTRYIIVGNLLHEDSLLKRLQKKIENGEVNGVYREYPITDEDGHPLWPGKFPKPEDIEEEKKKVMNPIAWAREYLLKIVSDEDQLIRREWIKTYKEIPQNTAGYYAIGIDPAISKKASADCTAMVSAYVSSRLENLRIYILPNPTNEKLTSLETIERAKDIYRALGKGKIFVEDVQYQGSLVEQLIKENFPAFPVKVHGQDKYARLKAVSFLVQAGKVVFPESGAGNLINQLIGFGTEKHDDLVDAFSILLSQILEDDHRPHAIGIRLNTDPNAPDLLYLGSREKEIELEKRRANARFFKI